MASKVMARRSRRADVPLAWTSVLAVMAHHDHVSYGLGAILDASCARGQGSR
jgi:LmbE family N-acetylglucosaminyl deacetylase